MCMEVTRVQHKLCHTPVNMRGIEEKIRDHSWQDTYTYIPPPIRYSRDLWVYINRALGIFPRCSIISDIVSRMLVSEDFVWHYWTSTLSVVSFNLRVCGLSIKMSSCTKEERELSLCVLVHAFRIPTCIVKQIASVGSYLKCKSFQCGVLMYTAVILINI